MKAPAFSFFAGADDRARGVVRHRAHVDRRHGEAAGVAAAHRQVEIVNRCRPDAGLGRERAQREARAAAQLRILAEHRRPDEAVDQVGGRRSA